MPFPARAISLCRVELRHLRYFVAVAEELNFTRAAARLHTSQPSLSQQIRQLESAVGVLLLDRSRHHVALTNAGRIFLREARDILGRIDHAGRLAKQAADGRAGELSVGTFPAADVRILPALRPRLAESLPNLRIVLHSKYALDPIKGLQSGALDVAFNFRYSPESTAQQLQARVRDILDRHSMQFDLEWTLIGEPFLTRRGPLVDAVTTSVESVTGVTPTLSTSGGTSDGRFLAKLAREVVEFGPLNDSIHKIDEHVRIADLGPLSVIYERALTRLFGLP